MGTNNFNRDNLYDLHHIVQSSMIVYPKEIILATLRDYFSNSTLYHFSKDQWGFANTTDHTDLPLGADLPYGTPGSTAQQNTLLSTRLFIGENYRHDGIYYPAILVKSGGSKYVPISINREKGSVEYDDMVYEDGYGNQTVISYPSYFFTAGVWEGSIAIDVLSRSLRARDDLVELIGMCFAEISVDSLYDIGVIVKPPHIGAPSETDDRNDKLFRQTITMDIRTEWRRRIKISNLIEAVVFSVEFSNLEQDDIVARNITINTEYSVLDTLLNQ